MESILSPGIAADNMASDPSIDGMKKKIETWVLQDGYKVTEESQPDIRFQFDIQSRDGLRFKLYQPAKNEESLALATALILTADQKNKLRLMERDDRAQFLWELRFGLLESGVGFSPIEDSLERITISTVIYFDGLNRNMFMESIALLRRMLIWSLMSLEKRFGGRSSSFKSTMYG